MDLNFEFIKKLKYGQIGGDDVGLWADEDQPEWTWGFGDDKCKLLIFCSFILLKLNE